MARLQPTSIPTDEHTTQTGRTREFLAACERILTDVRLNIDSENARRAPFLALPDSFLFGAQSVESELYPILWELVAVLTRPHDADRALRLDDLITKVLRLCVYHHALQNINIALAMFPNAASEGQDTAEQFTAR